MGGSPGSCKRALFVGRQLSMVASWIPLSSYFNCGELWTGEGLSAPLEGDRASGPAAAASAPAAASVEQSPAAADATTKGIREYSPVADACWAAGQPAPYMHLAQALAVLGPPPPFPFFLPLHALAFQATRPALRSLSHPTQQAASLGSHPSSPHPRPNSQNPAR